MSKKILLLGGSGLIGSRFLELNNSFTLLAPSSQELDILDREKLKQYFSGKEFDLVLNCTGYTNVDGAEDEKDDTSGLVYRLNVEGVAWIASLCNNFNRYFIHLSTDYVFAGKKEDSPYTEEDKTYPINWYGKTKLLGEEAVGENCSAFTIVRLEMPYSANYQTKKDFARFFLEKLKAKESITAISDQKITPIFVDDLVTALTRIIEKPTQGILHVTSTDPTSPYKFAKRLAAEFNLDEKLISSIDFESFNKDRQASRPKNSWLDVTKFINIYGQDILHTNSESISLFRNIVDSLT